MEIISNNKTATNTVEVEFTASLREQPKNSSRQYRQLI